MPTADEIGRMSYDDLGRLDPQGLSRDERRAARSRAIQLEADQDRANSAGRNRGLAARTVASGVLGIPAGLADAAQWVGRTMVPSYDLMARARGEEPGNPVDFSGALERGLDYAGMPRPEGFSENAAYDVGSNLIGMATPMGALRALPSLAARVGPRVAGFFTGRPALQASMAVTGGAGQAAAGELTDHDPWAEVGGAIAGSLAPLGGSAALSGLRRLTPAAREAARRQAAAGAVRDMASDPEGIVPAIEGNQDPLAGATRSLAEVTQDPRLAGFERVVRDDPNSGTVFAEADAARNAARTRGLEEAAPNAPDARVVSTALQEQIDRLGQVTDEALGDSQVRITGRVRDVGAEPTPGVSPAQVSQERGNTVRGALQTGLDDLRRRIGSTFGAVDPRQESGLVTTQLLGDLDNTIASRFQHVSPGDPAVGDVNRLLSIRDFIEGNAESGRVPFALLERQRNALLEIARRSGREDIADVATEMIAAIDRRIVPRSGLTRQDIARVGEGRQMQATQQRLFNEGPVATALDPATAAEDVASRLTPGDRLRGAASAPQQAIEAIGNNPAAVQALEQSLAERIVSAARRGPDIDPEKLRQALTGHGQALSQFPDLQRNLQALLTDTERHGLLSNLTGEALTRARSGAAQAWLGEVDTSSAMRRMLNNTSAQERVATELMRRIGHDPQAVEAAQGAFRDMLLQQATRNGELSMAALSGVFSRYEGAARTIMGRQGLTRLNNVIRDVRSELASQGRAQSTPGSSTQPRMSVARALTGILARHAINRGLNQIVPGAGYLRNLISAVRRSPSGPNAVVAQMVAQAMADPQYALELLRPATGAGVQRAAGVLEGLLRAGETGVATEGRERN